MEVTVLSDILEKARALAEAITESAEIAEFREKEIAMFSDEQAKKIIEEFQDKQKDIYAAQMQGQELTEEQKTAVVELEAKMQSNPKIFDYMEAEKNFESIMKSVNLIIMRALNGEEEEPSG